ncbi:tyrosine-type recombinase/integrase [Dechloromonas hortensis]|uniref:tyrosine-type recombinase/integrase n=1 Tax=Dechloromonas hortensis TaxID=337779 RepID=UPI00129094AD|nr:integrase arm-type DNA-binding domain-containing protein [Dechloromonas hortensis]
MPKPLTQLQVKSLAPTDKPKRYHDGGGLYLNITPNGAKSWVFRYMKDGKATTLGLGRYPDISLANARIGAADLRKKTHLGHDPAAEKRAVAEATQFKALTFDEAATACIDSRKDGWKNAKHISQWRNTLATYCKEFSSKSVGEVTINDVEAALRPVWLKKTETATRVLARIVSVLGYAHDKGWREDDDAESWAKRLRERRLPSLPKKSKRVKHHPALPFDQVPAFMVALRNSNALGSRLLEFAILCASRSSEAREATWSEVDLDAALWVIPKERMKTGIEHRVPLSAQAVALLKALPPGNPADHVFPGKKTGKSLSDMTMTAFIRRQNKNELKWKDENGEAITQHGFRSTFMDWAAETTPYPAAVADMALAHVISDKVRAAYQRGDLFEKRRALTQEWADYCTGPAKSLG